MKRINESQLRTIVAESVKRVLNEDSKYALSNDDAKYNPDSRIRKEDLQSPRKYALSNDDAKYNPDSRLEDFDMGEMAFDAMMKIEGAIGWLEFRLNRNEGLRTDEIPSVISRMRSAQDTIKALRQMCK